MNPKNKKLINTEENISSGSRNKRDCFDLVPFDKMFAAVSMSMLVGGFLPRYSHVRFWKCYTVSIFLYINIAFVMLIRCAYLDFKQNDLGETTRQMTIIIPLEMILVKILLGNYHEDILKSLIAEINDDYQEAKRLPSEYRQIIENGAKEGKFAEKIWCVTSSVVSFAFPLKAFMLMFFKNLSHNVTQKYMLHEFKLPFFDESKYKFPVYEVAFVFSFGVVLCCLLIFIAWDGLCLILMTHCKAQLVLVNHKLKDIFKNTDDQNEKLLQHRINNIVEHHQKIFRFFDRMQTFTSFFFWNIMALTSMQLCVTGFQIMESIETNDFNFEFYLFTFGTIIQVYLPCKYGTNLSDASVNVAEAAYSSGWESASSKSARTALAFIIMRAQNPLFLTAVGMVPVNMNSFSSILHTSWSYFTLLRSTE